MAAYFNEPDHTAHNDGPNSEAVSPSLPLTPFRPEPQLNDG